MAGLACADPRRRCAQGINFRDITTLLLDPEAFQHTIDLFAERYKGKGIDAVAGGGSLHA